MFMHADAEDLRFTHLVAADLAKNRRRSARQQEQQQQPQQEQQQRRPAASESVLNRSLDFTHVVDPRMSAGRQFCITKDAGYFGLVPRLSELGDVVVLFHGSKTPHVVRLCQSDTLEPSLACRLVGECYVHGIMDGKVWPRSPERTFVLE